MGVQADGKIASEKVHCSGAMLVSQPRGQRGVATIAALALVVTLKYLWTAGGDGEGIKAVPIADVVKGTPAADSGTVASSRSSQILQVYIFSTGTA